MSAMNFAFNPVPTFTFRLRYPSSPKFSPRLGQIILTRHSPADDDRIEISTPGLVCATSRGFVQHLSRDNVQKTPATKWIHVPFESFLQIDPPVPIGQGGPNPWHSFLGFPPGNHILSMSLRDPSDGREVPANGNKFVAAQTSRGSRKVSSSAYRSYVTSVLPDIAFAMSDVPFTPTPHSQKRTNKSIERSAQWLSTILAPLDIANSRTPLPERSVFRLNVFVHMAGGSKGAARSAFAGMLREPLDLKEKQLLQLHDLEQGVTGYVFDLLPLRISLLAETSETSTISECYVSPNVPHRPLNLDICLSFTSLMKDSLDLLPSTKPRLVNTALSPHEMLFLIRDVGVDLFDTFWVQQAATWGVALDFRFPVSPSEEKGAEKRNIGHNLYDQHYSHDFSTLADCFLSRIEGSNSNIDSNHDGVCICAACSPVWDNEPMVHSMVDELQIARGTREPAPPYTRAYIHHLLHTHEMSAHALLAMHNLTLLDAFMRGVRRVLQEGDPEVFSAEVDKFIAKYDESFALLDKAKMSWFDVDTARGKGRLAREREAAKVAVDLEVSAPTIKDIEEVIQG